MKIKYKKIIIMVTMCAMGIGLVAFSVNKPSSNNTNKTDKEVSTTITSSSSEQATEAQTNTDDNSKTTSTDSSSKTTEPTEIVLKDASSKVDKLIKNYLDAKLSAKLSGYKSLVNDTKLLDIDDIERKTKYIESYKNIKNYVIEGPEEGSYVVYAYHEIKFTGIDTLAPAMNEFYVTTNKDGEPRIYLGSIDETAEKYLDTVRNSDEVMDLIYNVNDALEKAVKKDVALSEFYLKLEESTKDVSMNN